MGWGRMDGLNWLGEDTKVGTGCRGADENRMKEKCDVVRGVG